MKWNIRTGAWFSIIRFLNVIGIITNAFIIGFTSNWSKNFLQNSLQNRFIFIVVFEVGLLYTFVSIHKYTLSNSHHQQKKHLAFAIWFLIQTALPDMPSSITNNIRIVRNIT